MSQGSLFDSGAPRPRRGRPGGRDDAPLTVGALNRSVRMELENRFGEVWVQGELSDVSRAASGHIYFTLNDERESAQVRAVMFRSDARRVRAKLEPGERVRIRARVTLFEPRGNFQLIASLAVPAGEGDLAARFRRLLAKLEKEGLTDPERKRPLPRVPRVVGVVTSPHGAALHDVIRVAQQRCPIRLVVAPCRVQGAEAPSSIVRALAALQNLPELDVVILTRGGGSAEDLAAFNEEQVARAVAACRVPIVCGVGHEVDVSLAELVADARAATPSNAAELVVPELETLTEQLGHAQRSLQRAMETRLDRLRLGLSRAGGGLSDPRQALGGARKRLQTLQARLEQAQRRSLAQQRAALRTPSEALADQDPRRRLSAQRTALERAHTRLQLSPARWLVARRQLLATQAARLQALSPLQVLARGYAIALREDNGRAVLSDRDVAPGDTLQLRLHEGQTRVEVLEDD